MKLTRIESRETFDLPKRPGYIIKLLEKTVEFYIEGREMKEEEMGDTIIQLVRALNAAETQIEELLKLVNELSPEDCDLSDYLDEFPEDEKFKAKYKIQEIKDALFHSMMKKDEKAISRYINKLNIAQEKVTT